jgi:hypothetical protein
VIGAREVWIAHVRPLKERDKSPKDTESPEVLNEKRQYKVLEL